MESLEEGVGNQSDVEYSASALYDGGWRSSDRDELKDEYNLSDEEVCKLYKESEKFD